MKQYVKKPIPIKAEQLNYKFNEKSIECDDISLWLLKMIETKQIYRDGDSFFINTLEGPMRVEDGSYIIEGVKGEIYVCKKDIFEETYEEFVESKII